MQTTTDSKAVKAAARYEQALAAYNEYLTSHPGYSGTVTLVQLERQMKQARRQWQDANR